MNKRICLLLFSVHAQDKQTPRRNTPGPRAQMIYHAYLYYSLTMLFIRCSISRIISSVILLPIDTRPRTRPLTKYYNKRSAVSRRRKYDQIDHLTSLQAARYKPYYILRRDTYIVKCITMVELLSLQTRYC